MQRSRWTFRPLLVLLVSISVVIAGCGVQPASAVSNKAYDGEELYRALFFLEGPAALLLPEQRVDAAQVQSAFAELSEDEQQIVAELRNQIVDVIKDNDATYFSAFAGDIQSGNPVRVERALVAAFEATQVATESIVGVDEGNDWVEITACGPTFCVAAVIIAIALVLVNYAAVGHSVANYLAIHDEVALWEPDGSSGPGTRPLSRDRTLAAITEQFALP